MFLPSTPAIRESFERQIASLGGTVTSALDEGRELFLRSTLPIRDEVRPRDRVQGGVALRTDDGDVLVHPYVFREVCSNGAVWAQALGTQRIERAEFAASNERIAETLVAIDAAIAACAEQTMFRNAVVEMKQATQVDAETNLLLQMAAHSIALTTGVLEAVRRFHRDRDQSLYGLMNAVTSVARDTRDPDTRWRLEELGGGIPSLIQPSPTRDGTAAELLTVGCG